MRKFYLVKFVFLPQTDGLPLLVYMTEQRHFGSAPEAWRHVYVVLDQLDEDDLSALCRVMVYRGD